MKKKKVSWTKAQMNALISSDESKFNLHESDNKWYVWRHKSEAYYSDYISDTTTFPEKQMIGRNISSKGIGCQTMIIPSKIIVI